jgi:hypothetical protein
VKSYAELWGCSVERGEAVSSMRYDLNVTAIAKIL